MIKTNFKCKFEVRFFDKTLKNKGMIGNSENFSNVDNQTRSQNNRDWK